jgi:hypothetical protein
VPTFADRGVPRSQRDGSLRRILGFLDRLLHATAYVFTHFFECTGIDMSKVMDRRNSEAVGCNSAWDNYATNMKVAGSIPDEVNF